MVPYKLRVIAGVITDVLRDIAVGHPFGDRRQLDGVRNSDETKDVGMGQVLPQCNLFTEALWGV